MALIRDIDPDVLTALSGVFHPVVMIEVEWTDGTAYAHSNIGTIDYDGHDWLGIGGLASVGVPDEAAGPVNDEFRVGIVGALDDLFDHLDDEARGGDLRILIGLTATPGGTDLIGDPIELVAGAIDSNDLTGVHIGDGQEAQLSVMGAVGPSARATAEFVHTDESQKAEFAGDTLFRHVINAGQRPYNPQTWPETD